MCTKPRRKPTNERIDDKERCCRGVCGNRCGLRGVSLGIDFGEGLGERQWFASDLGCPFVGRKLACARNAHLNQCCGNGATINIASELMILELLLRWLL